PGLQALLAGAGLRQYLPKVVVPVAAHPTAAYAPAQVAAAQKESVPPASGGGPTPASPGFRCPPRALGVPGQRIVRSGAQSQSAEFAGAFRCLLNLQCCAGGFGAARSATDSAVRWTCSVAVAWANSLTAV